MEIVTISLLLSLAPNRLFNGLLGANQLDPSLETKKKKKVLPQLLLLFPSSSTDSAGLA